MSRPLNTWTIITRVGEVACVVRYGSLDALGRAVEPLSERVFSNIEDAAAFVAALNDPHADKPDELVTVLEYWHGGHFIMASADQHNLILASADQHNLLLELDL